VQEPWRDTSPEPTPVGSLIPLAICVQYARMTPHSWPFALPTRRLCPVGFPKLGVGRYASPTGSAGRLLSGPCAISACLKGVLSATVSGKPQSSSRSFPAATTSTLAPGLSIRTIHSVCPIEGIASQDCIACFGATWWWLVAGAFRSTIKEPFWRRLLASPAPL
jgi:hypothetical protein